MSSEQSKKPKGGASAMKSLANAAGAAARLVGAKAEQTKLTTLTLPAAYRALGKDCFQNKRHLEACESLVEQIEKVLAEGKALTEATKNQAAPQSFTDKAKAAGKQGADMARQKSLSMKRDSLLGDLGKAIFEQHHDNSGPEQLVKPIQDALARVVAIDEQIKTLSAVGAGSWITPKRLLVAVAVLVLLGTAGTWKQRPGQPDSKNKPLQVAIDLGDAAPQIVELTHQEPSPAVPMPATDVQRPVLSTKNESPKNPAIGAAERKPSTDAGTVKTPSVNRSLKDGPVPAAPFIAAFRDKHGEFELATPDSGSDVVGTPFEGVSEGLAKPCRFHLGQLKGYKTTLNVVFFQSGATKSLCQILVTQSFDISKPKAETNDLNGLINLIEYDLLPGIAYRKETMREQLPQVMGNGATQKHGQATVLTKLKPAAKEIHVFISFDQGEDVASMGAQPSSDGTKTNTNPSTQISSLKLTGDQKQAIADIKRLHGQVYVTSQKDGAPQIAVSFNGDNSIPFGRPEVRGPDLKCLAPISAFLTELNLEGTSVTDCSLLEPLTNLRVLYLCRSLDMWSLAPIGRLPRLESLSVHWTSQNADITKYMISSVCQCRTLRHLRLFNVAGAERNVNRFEWLSQIATHLRFLQIDCGGVTEKEGRSISECEQLETLQIAIDDDAGRIKTIPGLLNLAKCKSLRTLSVNSVNDKLLEEILQLSTLTTIHAEENSLSDSMWIRLDKDATPNRKLLLRRPNDKRNGMRLADWWHQYVPKTHELTPLGKLSAD